MRLVNGSISMVICTCETNSLTLSANLHAIDLQTQWLWGPISTLLKENPKDLVYNWLREHDNKSFINSSSLMPNPDRKAHV